MLLAEAPAPTQREVDAQGLVPPGAIPAGCTALLEVWLAANEQSIEMESTSDRTHPLSHLVLHSTSSFLPEGAIMTNTVTHSTLPSKERELRVQGAGILATSATNAWTWEFPTPLHLPQLVHELGLHRPLALPFHSPQRHLGNHLPVVQGPLVDPHNCSSLPPWPPLPKWCWQWLWLWLRLRPWLWLRLRPWLWLWLRLRPWLWLRLWLRPWPWLWLRPWLWRRCPIAKARRQSVTAT
mmetsp:Transcript_8255/g.18455  ORF Transcript_8255/g.18455 Transcript_8255/m.18455 type:complete len:238 (+) Transcript_8255:239-952(+)